MSEFVPTPGGARCHCRRVSISADRGTFLCADHLPGAKDRPPAPSPAAEPTPEPARICENCGGPIAATKQKTARFCSADCRHQASQRLQRQKAASNASPTRESRRAAGAAARRAERGPDRRGARPA